MATLPRHRSFHVRPGALVVASAALTISLVGCTEDISGTQQSVVAGRGEKGYAPVGYLAVGRSSDALRGPNCGATLIAPTLAVTADHCIEDGKYYGIGFGDVYSSSIHAATRVVRHPSAYHSGSTRYRHDVAVLELAEPVEGIEPATIGETITGNTNRYVGYGRNTEGNYDVETGYTGERKSAAERVYWTDSYNVWTQGVDGGLCWGDSGGPLMGEGDHTIFGVLADFEGSFYCSSGNTMIFTALAREMRFLRPLMARAGVHFDIADEDGDGVPDDEDLCSATEAGAEVWTTSEWNGCASGQHKDGSSSGTTTSDSDDDGVPDESDRCSRTPRGSTIWTSGEWRGCAGGETPDW